MSEQVFDAIVLAGGLGTRLRSAVPDRPKPLAPVAGKPFLDYLLSHLAQVGVRRVILSIGYLGEQIKQRYGHHHGQLSIVYCEEDQPLGTGGALKQALALSTTSYTLALNGDTLLQFDPRPFLQACQASQQKLGIVTRPVGDTARYGRCTLEQDTIASFGEKGTAGPGLINAGVYCLRRDLFDAFDLPARFSFESDVIEPHLQTLRPLGCQTDAYFIDIGVPEDFARAQVELPTLTW